MSISESRAFSIVTVQLFLDNKVVFRSSPKIYAVFDKLHTIGVVRYEKTFIPFIRSFPYWAGSTGKLMVIIASREFSIVKLQLFSDNKVMSRPCPEIGCRV